MEKLFKPFMFLMIPLVSVLAVSCHDEDIVDEPVILAPTISAVSPEQAKVGTEITITGTELKEVTSVKFGGVDAEGFDAAANTGTTIKATVPAAAVVGAQKIVVSSPGGTAEFAFTVLEEEQPEPVPTITGISPEEGRAGSEVVISGTNLAGTTELKFGEVVLSGYTATAESITFTVPEEAVPGAVTITVSTPGGEASTGFTVLAPEPVLAFSPAKAGPGTVVTVSGTDFTGTTAVKLGDIAATEVTVAEDGSSLTFTVPDGVTGSAFSVETPAGTWTSEAFSFMQGLVADFDVNGIFNWPQNGGTPNWGWGIPNESIVNAAEGIQASTGYFGLINVPVEPNMAWNNNKVINLVNWSENPIFPTAPAAVYDPAAPASDFVIKLDVAVAQPASLEGLVLTVAAFDVNDVRIYKNIPMADFISSTDGTWYNLSVPLSELTGDAGATFATYGDLLAGGRPVSEGSETIVQHFRVVVNNSKAAGTEPIQVAVAVDNIQIVKAP